MGRASPGTDFDAWMIEWADVITRFAYRPTRHWMTAQDVAQETFLRAYRHYQSKGVVPSAGWLFRVASRLVIDEARHRRHEAWGEVAETGGSGSAVEPEVSLDVLDVLEALSDRDRECLVLFYFRD